MEISSSKEEYRLKPAVLQHFVAGTEGGATLINALRSLDHLNTGRGHHNLDTVFSDLVKVIEEDVKSYLDYIKDDKECDKYKDLKKAFKELIK